MGGSYFPNIAYADLEIGQIKQVLFMIAVVTIVFLIWWMMADLFSNDTPNSTNEHLNNNLNMCLINIRSDIQTDKKVVRAIFWWMIPV